VFLIPNIRLDKMERYLVFEVLTTTEYEHQALSYAPLNILPASIASEPAKTCHQKILLCIITLSKAVSSIYMQPHNYTPSQQ